MGANFSGSMIYTHEKCPYSENYGPYFSALGENTERYKACTPNTGKFGPEKLRIRTLVPNCSLRVCFEMKQTSVEFSTVMSLENQR